MASVPGATAAPGGSVSFSFFSYRRSDMPTRIAAWFFACCCASGLARAAQPEGPNLPIEAYRLPNGLKVVLLRDPTVPRVTVCVAYHVGSKNERAGRTGFAHFFEHMMFRGTKNVPSYDIPLQEAGAVNNAFTSEDMTVYYETVPSDYLERALYLEAERLAFLPSALDQEKFDTEREVVKNERRMRIDNVPYGLADETLLAHVFPAGHPYSWSVIGSMEDLNNSSLKDLKRFFAEFYHPANATLCLVGDFDPAQARKWIATYFGALEAGPVPKKVEVSPSPDVAERITLVDRVQLPRVYWSWRTVPDDHPDTAALDLLSLILAGGEASRLHKRLVVESQIATDVGAASDTKEVAGQFTLEATAAPGHTVDEIELVFQDEIERAGSSAPKAEELARAQAQMEKSLYSRMTSPLNRAVSLARGFAMYDDPNYYRREFARYFRVTPGDIQDVAKRYLGSKKVVLVIRPAEKGETKSQAVQVGPKVSGAAETELADRTPRPGPDWSKVPGPTDPGTFKPPAIVRRKLSNGIDVWIAPWHSLPIVNTHLLIGAGTSDDPEGESGLATLTATLLDKGTKDKTATELAEALALLGTSTAVRATVDHTVVSFSLVARNLAPALGLVGEMLAAPRFDPKDFDRERQLQLTELLQGPDNPGWIARRAFRAVLYGPKHPYGKPSEGYVDTVKALTADDVRAFHKAHFGANRAILVVVGDVEPDSLMKSLEATIGAWKSETSAPAAIPAPEMKSNPEVAFVVDKPGSVQSVLDIGRLWVGRDDPRYFATMLGNRILGGDFLSRLMQNLRAEHGYTYGVQSAFLYRRGGSVWAVQSSVRTDATTDALKELKGELGGVVKDRPFTPEEISVAKGAEIRAFPEAFEDPASIAGIIEEMALFALPADYLDTYLDRLSATTAEQIQKAMAEVVDPAQQNYVIVGDLKVFEPKLKPLGFREVRLLTTDGLPASK
jgi:zinc protease